MRRVFQSLLATSLLLAPAVADEPSVSYIFPAGGQRGTTVDFKVGGHFLHGKAPLEMLGSGVDSSETIVQGDTVWFEGPIVHFPTSSRPENYPLDHFGSVKIAPDAQLGVRYWRIWTSQGATDNMQFVVGDLPEIVEEEIDGAPVPTSVTLPVTINGRIFPREDVDIWTVAAKRGQQVTCEVNAARIGSPLDARLEIRGPDGRTVAEGIDRLGVDPRIRFTAPADGDYAVHIHDVNYAGLQHYVYRLTITSDPYVDYVYPLGGRRGTTVAVQLSGQAVPAQPVKVRLPQDAARTFHHRASVGGKLTNRFALDVGDLDEHLENEPNDQPGQPPLPVPAVFNGRIQKPGDVDVWMLQVAQGEQWEMDLRASRLGSPLDSLLEVLDAEGKVVASNDDLATNQPDSRLTFKAPADGVYQIRVAERFRSRGGPAFAYRLQVDKAPAEPDFEVKLSEDVINVFRELPEAETEEADNKRRRKPKQLKQPVIKVDIVRLGGFQDEIELLIEGLPEGVTVEGTKIAAKRPNTQLRFTAAPTTKIAVSKIKIRATAQIGEKQVIRPAQLPSGKDPKQIDHVLLAVAMPTPFSYDAEYLVRYAAQGSVYHRGYKLNRGGFTGPLTVRLADRQGRHLQGVTGPTITLPPEATEFEYPIHLPPWMVLGRTSRSVIMLSGVVKDHDGSEHTVSFSSNEQNHQVIVILAPGKLAVETDRPAVVIRPGSRGKVPVRIRRTKPLAGVPVHVELIVPPHIRGIAAQPITVPPGQSEATLVVEFVADCTVPNMPLLIRATGQGQGDPHIAETKLELVSVSPVAQK